MALFFCFIDGFLLFCRRRMRMNYLLFFCEKISKFVVRTINSVLYINSPEKYELGNYRH